MDNPKKYWCFNCNSECQINIIKEGDDEEYQCTKCTNTFIEEISNVDNPQNFHIEQTQTQTNNIQNNLPVNSINISIESVNTININDMINNNNNNDNNNSQNENQTAQDQYGMNDTLLFLPSTVNYVVRNNNNNSQNINNLLNGRLGGIVTEIVGPNGHNILFSQNIFNRNRPILGFLSNHNNDNQFENFLNILMSFDISHKGNPPASERAINNLKKIEINKDNIKKFNEETCNVCLEGYVEGQTSIKLDCGHYFHDKCIIQWLKMRNTCPVCRHELESNDPNYEKRKHSHRETLRNIHSNYGNNNNNGNNNDGSEAAA
jgi:hypothetical protein